MQTSNHRHIRGGFTFLDLLAMVATIFALTSLLFQGVQSTRETANRTACVNRAKQIALSLHNYASARQDRFPAANDRIFNPAGTGVSTKIGEEGSGYSWIVHILPYFEEGKLYDRIALASTGLAGAFSNPPLDEADVFRNAKIEGLICPSWGGNPLIPVAAGQLSNWGATCYKAMAGRGACAGTVSVSSGTASAGGAWSSEDGYLTLLPAGSLPQTATAATARLYTLPGRNFISGDGTSKTFLVAETKEGAPGPAQKPSYNSAWAMGSQAWLVASIPSDGCKAWSGTTYTGLTRSGLNFGPSESNKSQNFGDLAVGPKFNSVAMNWGPSSDHAGGLVFHGMGDGSIRPIRADIDASIYAALSTVSGGENVPLD